MFVLNKCLSIFTENYFIRQQDIEEYIDGSGNGKYGFFIEETNETKITKRGITNNQAEYLAVLEALSLQQET